MDYSHHLDQTIRELQHQILQMETITNKTNPHKRPLEMKYLTHKSSVPTTLPDLNSDIDKILMTAEQFLQDPSKTLIEPKKTDSKLEEYDPPKRKPIEPYKPPTKKAVLSRKISQKKLSPQKVSTHKRSGSLYKQQEITPKVTQVPPKFPYQTREPTKSFKDQSRLIKQSPSKSILEKNSILIEDQSRIKQQVPQRKQNQQPYIQLQPIQQQQSQNNSSISLPQTTKAETQPSQTTQSVLKKLEFSGYKELGRLRRMKEAVFVEYQQSYTYFKDKEQKARAKFLTKFHQHMNERKKLLQQSAYGDRQTFFFLSDQIDPQYFKFVEEQLTIGQPKTLLILKYCELIQTTVDAIEFDDELLKNLKRANKQNIGKISLTDLIEVFKLWSQVQIIRQNYQQLTQFIQPIPDQTYELIKWINLRPKQQKKDKQSIQLSQKVIRFNQYAATQEEALETNRLIIKEEVFRFLWDVIQKLVFSKQQLETSIGLFKTILKLITNKNCSVYIFKKSDLA